MNEFLVGRQASPARHCRGVPATCPNGGATADSHGLSRTTCQQTRRSANPQVTAMQRHRLPKLIVRVRLAMLTWRWSLSFPSHPPQAAPGRTTGSEVGGGQGAGEEKKKKKTSRRRRLAPLRACGPRGADRKKKGQASWKCSPA